MSGWRVGINALGKDLAAIGNPLESAFSRGRSMPGRKGHFKVNQGREETQGAGQSSLWIFNLSVSAEIVASRDDSPGARTAWSASWKLWHKNARTRLSALLWWRLSPRCAVSPILNRMLINPAGEWERWQNLFRFFVFFRFFRLKCVFRVQRVCAMADKLLKQFSCPEGDPTSG